MKVVKLKDEQISYQVFMIVCKKDVKFIDL